MTRLVFTLIMVQSQALSTPHLYLQPAFEGTFKLQMSIIPALVSPGVDMVDPAGHSRNHIVNVNMVGHGPGATYEDAAWVPQDKEEVPAGKADVSMSNGFCMYSLF